jgi:hypothetical protein
VRKKIPVAELCVEALNHLYHLYYLDLMYSVNSNKKKAQAIDKLMCNVKSDIDILQRHIFNWRLDGHCDYRIPKFLREKYGPRYGDFKGIFKGLTFKKRDL